MNKKLSTNPPVLKRDFNLDLIRIIAFCFVPSVHFLLHGGFYSNDVSTDKMELILFFRTLFLLCIPLFLLLTGYLQGEKEIEPNRKYFFKISKFIVPYLIIMLIDVIIIDEIFTPQLPGTFPEYETKQYVQNFTSFTHYSWYVEMYIGLFLLIPFLNMIWRNVKTKGAECFLLISLIAISILPNLLNTFDLKAENIMAVKDVSNWKLWPSWWTKLYPITYYFTGAFLARHKNRFKINPFLALGIFLLSWFGVGKFVVERMQDVKPSIMAFTDYNSPGIYLMGVTLFIFVNSIPFNKVPMFLRKAVGKLSDLTFGAYLGSWALDQLFYPLYLNKKTAVFEDRWDFFPFAMLIVIPTAFIIAYLTDLLYRTGKEIFNVKIRKKKS